MARLQAYNPSGWDLGLTRLLVCLERLDNPHNNMPPVFHVAGTNGKGSTLAFLRSLFDAIGLQTHGFTSPHLVRFNERIRLHDNAITEAQLSHYIDIYEKIAKDTPVTFFELTAVLAFLAYRDIKADYILLETGLGGRLDATNVIDNPFCTIITRIAMDHKEWLGDDIITIAGEKAGIIKTGAPCVIGYQENQEIYDVFLNKCRALGARSFCYGRDWYIEILDNDRFAYHSTKQTTPLVLNRPALNGDHQLHNAGQAIAALDVKGLLPEQEKIHHAMARVTWPARLQEITEGRLYEHCGTGAKIYLDGGHNNNAATALADFCKKITTQNPDQPLYLIWGMIKKKDAAGFLSYIADFADGVVCYQGLGASKYPTLQEDGSLKPKTEIRDQSMIDEDMLCKIAKEQDIKNVSQANNSLLNAIAQIKDLSKDHAPIILVCGSLYLAGDFLKDNESVIL